YAVARMSEANAGMTPPDFAALIRATRLQSGKRGMGVQRTRGHARACRGHPRLSQADVDGRDEPGHDGKSRCYAAARRSEANAGRRARIWLRSPGLHDCNPENEEMGRATHTGSCPRLSRASTSF